MAIYRAGSKGKLHVGAAKVKKVYQGNRKVYSSGNICTYHMDTGISYTEEVEEGASCLSPGTFTPEKEGWEFAGWRQDGAAEGEVLGSMVMGDDPVTLYALFKQDVILTTVANGITAEQTGQMLYNNGNLASPAFTVASPSKAGATFKGWSSGAGSTDITSPTIINLELDTSTTRWAVFEYPAASPKFTAGQQHNVVVGDTIHYYATSLKYGNFYATIPGEKRPVVFTRDNTLHTLVTSIGTVSGTTQNGNAGGTFTLTIYSDFDFGVTVTLNCPAYKVVG